MDFNYTAEQDALRDSVKRFVEREYDWENAPPSFGRPRG